MDNNSAPRLFFIVLADDDWLGGALCSISPVESKTPQVIAAVEKMVSNKDQEGILSSFDEIFSKCLDKAGENRESISNLIFVVSPFWTTDQGLIPSKAEILKEIYRKYQFSSGKFLVDDEALVDYYSLSEGSPPNFIGLFVGIENFRLSLAYLGKIRGRVKNRIDGNKITAHQVKEALLRLDFDGVLPPQILVWGKLPPGFSQSLVEYPWVEEEKLFLHLPDVKNLTLNAVAEIFATLIQKRLISGELKTEAAPVAKTPVEEEKDDRKAIALEEEIGEKAGADTESLPEGFYYEDIAEVKREESEKTSDEEVAESVVKKKEVEEEKSLKGKKTSRFSRFLSLLALFRRFPRRFTSKVVGKKLTLGLIPFVLVLAGLFFWLYRVEILLFVTPQLIHNKTDVVLKSGVAFDPNSGIIPVKEVSTTVEVSGREASTGEKLVGEKAKGRVRVYNRTASSKLFPKGTVIIGPSDLRFIFKEEVKVASKTPDLVSGADRWGKAEVEVEAAKIGSKYNLAKGAVFKIQGEDQNSFLVKSIEDFQGGTSRSLTAVSAEDVNRLKENLLKEATQMGKSQVLGLVSDNDRPIDEKFVVEVSSFTTDKKIGDEADSVEGNLTAKVSTLTFSNEHLRKLAQKILESEKKKELVLKPETLKFKFNLGKQENGGVRKAELVVEGKAYPRLDEEKIKEELVGKNKVRIAKIVKSIPRVYRYQVKISPGWFKFFPLLPFNDKNIFLQVREE
jgi:hypothetical protein